MNKKIKIAPSILSANFTKIGEEIKRLEVGGADLVHLDIMDGVFVPNITFGIKMVDDIKKITYLPLDCHLMIADPQKYIEKFASAGADFISVHYEACKDNLPNVLMQIKNCGVKCGMVINPDTPVSSIEKYIAMCDYILIMSVYPGFGGQEFIIETLEKCSKIKEIIERNNLDCEIEIDGGINAVTAEEAKKSGCNILVAGSYVFNSDDIATTIAGLKI